MNIQVNTDNHIVGREELTTEVKSLVESGLGRFRERITRIEVHLSDENSVKGGEDDKRCMIEARIEGLQPTVATHHAGTINDAVHGAVDKIKRALDSTLQKRQDARRA